MVHAKQYLTPRDKLFVDIANGFEKVTDENFEAIREVLFTSDMMLRDKSALAKVLLGVSGVLDRRFDSNRNAVAVGKFNSSPMSFSLGYPSDSVQFKCLEFTKGGMKIANNLYGHFCVSVRLNNFMIDKYNTVAHMYNDLSAKHRELEAKLKVAESGVKELPAIQTEKKSVLVKLDGVEEKKDFDLRKQDVPEGIEEEVEEFVEDEMREEPQEPEVLDESDARDLMRQAKRSEDKKNALED